MQFDSSHIKFFLAWIKAIQQMSKELIKLERPVKRPGNLAIHRKRITQLFYMVATQLFYMVAVLLRIQNIRSNRKSVEIMCTIRRCKVFQKYQRQIRHKSLSHETCILTLLPSIAMPETKIYVQVAGKSYFFFKNDEIKAERMWHMTEATTSLHLTQLLAKVSNKGCTFKGDI